MKLIIAATDFSAVGNNASIYAGEMAKALDAELLLVNVYQMPMAFATDPVAAPIDELRDASAYGLKALKREITERCGSQLTITMESRMGYVREEMEDLCASREPFMVVIGTTGKSNFAKMAFGSVAVSLVHHLKSPVLCVPANGKFGSGIHKIGFACDFREVTETVPAKEMIAFVKTWNASLEIVNVDYKDHHFRASGIENSFALHQMFQKIKPRYHYIEDRHVPAGLVKFVKDQSIDVLIALPKHHGVLKNLFSTSHTDQLMLEINIPMLSMHA